MNLPLALATGLSAPPFGIKSRIGKVDINDEKDNLRNTEMTIADQESHSQSES